MEALLSCIEKAKASIEGRDGPGTMADLSFALASAAVLLHDHNRQIIFEEDGVCELAVSIASHVKFKCKSMVASRVNAAMGGEL